MALPAVGTGSADVPLRGMCAGVAGWTRRLGNGWWLIAVKQQVQLRAKEFAGLVTEWLHENWRPWPDSNRHRSTYAYRLGERRDTRPN